MSTSLAIAAVSAVLRDVLAARFAVDPVASAIGSVTVSVLPPDRVDLSTATDPNQVNIFLHQVTRNPGWANIDLPSRDSDGRRTTTPPLALDLHYLVTVFGASQLYSEILLGEVLQEFHDRPVPTRPIIERALSPSAPPAGFPTQIALSGIAEQIERIRIAPETIPAEDVSRLWSALQARYRATVAYQVTTVVLESMAASRPALPVARRLGTVVPSSTPAIVAVRSTAGAQEPILPGGELIVTGSALVAADYVVEVGGQDISGHVTAAHADSITLVLPEPLPAGVRPGVAGLQVIHRQPLGDPPLPHQAAVSNTAPFVLRPRVSATAAVTTSETIDGTVYQSGVLTVQFTTPIGRGQRLEVLLNERDAAGGHAYRLKVPDGLGLPVTTDETLTVEVPFVRLAAGTYLLRARVDGADSVLDADPATGRFATPAVTL